ncbi:Uncharacterised protein [Sphingobacterium spiritivorum]|uniref:Uncharacterized protein n=1 Tax=Sphingobacterium spiritivorum TaxID=258 RepID=A0A380CB49_SPHSI|nr:hypothetical protein [Sphingobacterium spiritivorum]SUJ16252.1 Uncharacterised protein [Sphingobacterium spiritivorum]
MKYDIDITAIDNYQKVFEVLKTQKVNQDLLDYYYKENLKSSLQNWLQLQLKKSTLETSVLSKYNRNILKLDATNLSLQWNQSKNTWFLPKWLQQRKIKNQLQAYAKNKLSDASVVDQLFSDLEDIEHVNLQLSSLVFFRNENTCFSIRNLRCY